jgi:Protein of unknown function (DUF2817)
MHTGLGPPGKDSLLANDEPTCERIREMVGIPAGAVRGLAEGDCRVQNTARGTESVAFVMEGDSCDGVVQMAGAHDNVVAFAQEFGTVPSLDIFVALRRENARFHKLLADGADGAAHSWDRVRGPRIQAQRDAVRSVFFLDTPEWRESVLLRGVRVADDVIGFLLGSALKAHP